MSNGSNSSAVLMHTALEDGLFGIFWMVLSGIVLLCYIPCLVVIRTDPALQNHSCYRMMFQLGLSDAVTLGSHFLLGLLTTFQLSYQIPYWFNRVLGAAIEAWGWFMYTWLIHVMAFNRFIQICLKKHAYTVFGPTTTKIWQGVCWLYGGLWFAALMSPWGGFLYFPENYSFYFQMDKPWYDLLKTLAWWQNIVNFSCTTLWYLAIFIYMKVLKWSVRVDTGEDGETISTNLLSNEERAILKQAAVIGLYTVTYDQMWHFLPSLYFVYNYDYAFIFGNYCWITTCFVNPLVYLTVNETVSQKVKIMIGLKPKVSQRSQTMTNRSSMRKHKGSNHRASANQIVPID